MIRFATVNSEGESLDLHDSRVGAQDDCNCSDVPGDIVVPVVDLDTVLECRRNADSDEAALDTLETLLRAANDQ